MEGNLLLLLAALVPIAAAPLAYGMGRRTPHRAVYTMIAACLLDGALLCGLLPAALWGEGQALTLNDVCGFGLMLKADGFRTLYACVAAFMWLITSVFSLDYFEHEKNVGRYCLFTLFTFGATVGLFLSDSLYTAFLFFEVMSLSSYPWVAHEEDPAAMRAAQTYLYIAIIGGLTTLMGLFLLPENMALIGLDQLGEAAGAVGADALWLPAVLVLIGFGAKAGAFPLHIWLPKAHPVAPAPASALLSGMLTKAGILGVLILTCGVMQGCQAWGDMIFRLGVITMVLGAALAIASENLKRTLACSSLSQIGFIMIGAGLCGMLGEENGLVAYGTVGHMVNHSLFKLTLFLCAGVVAMNTHRLALKDVQGYGRGKPLLQALFLCGALGISGVPLFSGYLSKSLLHEGILEWIAVVEARGQNPLIYRLSEVAFLVSGGMTLCYMLKLYVCLFVKKNPERQAAYDGQKRYMSPVSGAALALAAAMIPAIGLLPGVLMTGIGRLSQSFLHAAAPALPIHYFSAENLTGAAESIGIGLCLYGLTLLWEKRRGAAAVQPGGSAAWRFDLENCVYRPLLKGLCQLGYGVAYLLDHLTDWLTVLLKTLGMALAGLMDGAGDSLALAARKTVLSPKRPPKPAPVGTRFTYGCGSAMDGAVAVINRVFRRKEPTQFSFVTALAALHEEAAKQSRQLTRSISFGLMLFCVGLFATLAYLLY